MRIAQLLSNLASLSYFNSPKAEQKDPLHRFTPPAIEVERVIDLFKAEREKLAEFIEAHTTTAKYGEKYISPSLNQDFRQVMVGDFFIKESKDHLEQIAVGKDLDLRYDVIESDGSSIKLDPDNIRFNYAELEKLISLRGQNKRFFFLRSAENAKAGDLIYNHQHGSIYLILDTPKGKHKDFKLTILHKPIKAVKDPQHTIENLNEAVLKTCCASIIPREDIQDMIKGIKPVNRFSDD